MRHPAVAASGATAGATGATVVAMGQVAPSASAAVAVTGANRHINSESQASHSAGYEGIGIGCRIAARASR